MDKTIAEQCREQAEDASVPAGTKLLLTNAAHHLEKQGACLRMAADRFDDLAGLIAGGESYTNIGFFRASARRCRELDF